MRFRETDELGSAPLEVDGAADSDGVAIRLPFADAGPVLRKAVRDVLRSSEPSYERVVVSVCGINVLGWLTANPNEKRLFWSSRNGDGAHGGVGVADRVAAGTSGTLEELREQVESRLFELPPDVRYYGGLRFDLGQPTSAEWQSFGNFEFVLPRVEVRESDAGTIVCVNLTPVDWEQPDEIARALDNVVFSQAPTGDLPSPVFREDIPNQTGWRANIEWALAAFSRSRLAKVVLARRATLGFEDVVSSTALMDELIASTTNCYHFMFQAPDGASFVGASPERLFKLDGRHVWSEAVAGTRPRGDTAGADAELCKELLLSEKDQREHVYVRQSIKETLSALCSELHVDASASEMRLTRGRHLVSRVEGRVEDGVSAIDLLIGLHPTPAVGGYPTPDAMEAIARLEGFDRGWYAAPVGWISRDCAEFAVAIRSGLVDAKKVSLYSGAGIVGGSTAAGEWAEIEDKIADFVSVFGTDGTAIE